MPTTDGKIAVLSLSGGGIRGVLTARILQFIEEQAGKPVSKLFNMICGTSTGGLLAAALCKPNPLTAAQAVELYRLRGSEIFGRSLWHSIKTLGGKIGPKYDGIGLDRVLEDVFGSTPLGHTETPLFMPAYDIEHRCVVFFKSWEGSDALTIPLKDACRATSAGPTYFPPGMVQNRYFIDGGTVNNNPALSGVIEACMVNKCHTKDAVVVSIGTGLAVEPINHIKAAKWGPLGWVTPLISVFTDGVSDLTDYQMKDLMRDENFFYYQTILPPEHSSMDNASDINISFLIHVAETVIDANRQELITLANRLKGA